MLALTSNPLDWWGLWRKSGSPCLSPVFSENPATNGTMTSTLYPSWLSFLVFRSGKRKMEGYFLWKHQCWLISAFVGRSSFFIVVWKCWTFAVKTFHLWLESSQVGMRFLLQAVPLKADGGSCIGLLWRKQWLEWLESLREKFSVPFLYVVRKDRLWF